MPKWSCWKAEERYVEDKEDEEEYDEEQEAWDQSSKELIIGCIPHKKLINLLIILYTVCQNSNVFERIEIKNK